MSDAQPIAGSLLTIVIPLFNEQESLRLLHTEIDAICPAASFHLEIIFVDDGSTDGSWKVIRELAAEDSRVRGIRFRKNFGKAAALSAGFKAVRGPICMTLDADLQDDPGEIPRFLKILEDGADVVSGWKKVRYDPWHKVLPSKVFNWLVSWLTGVHLRDHNSGMKCYRNEVLQELRLYGELHRFIPVLAAARGFKVMEIPIQHRPRKFGSTKYGIRRFVKGFLDLLTVKFLTSFGHRPQHMLGTIGLFAFATGLLGLGYLGITWIIRLFDPDAFSPIHTRPLMVYSVAALLLGAQMLSMGILAELITAHQSRDEEAYSIAEKTGGG